MGFNSSEEGLFIARRRHLDALKKSKDHILIGLSRSEHKTEELLAEDLHRAQLALAEITGEITSEDLLDKIFSTFCIGK